MKDFFTEADSDNPWSQNKGWINVEKANRLLRERSKVVYGSPDVGWMVCKPIKGSDDDWHTHQALIFSIEPLEQDSAEKFLREWIEHAENMVPQLTQTPFIQRAKALLRLHSHKPHASNPSDSECAGERE